MGCAVQPGAIDLEIGKQRRGGHTKSVVIRRRGEGGDIFGFLVGKKRLPRVAPYSCSSSQSGWR